MIDMIGVGPFITMPLIVSAMGGVSRVARGASKCYCSPIFLE